MDAPADSESSSWAACGQHPARRRPDTGQRQTLKRHRTRATHLDSLHVAVQLDALCKRKRLRVQNGTACSLDRLALQQQQPNQRSAESQRARQGGDSCRTHVCALHAEGAGVEAGRRRGARRRGQTAQAEAEPQAGRSDPAARHRASEGRGRGRHGGRRGQQHLLHARQLVGKEVVVADAVAPIHAAAKTQMKRERSESCGAANEHSPNGGEELLGEAADLLIARMERVDDPRQGLVPLLAEHARVGAGLARRG